MGWNGSFKEETAGVAILLGTVEHEDEGPDGAVVVADPVGVVVPDDIGAVVVPDDIGAVVLVGAAEPCWPDKNKSAFYTRSRDGKRKALLTLRIPYSFGDQI